jgi:phage terminase small subunit
VDHPVKLEGVTRKGARRGRAELVRDPTWVAFRDASTLALTLGLEFGLTPRSAVRLKLATPAVSDVEGLFS